MLSSTVTKVLIGVGIDTARYGHYASFLFENRNTALRGFTFEESRAGYDRLHDALERLAQRHDGLVTFHIRIDAAGQYAANLEAYLRQLPFDTSISVGEPKRNRDYKNAHFPKAKSDPVDSMSCARFAVVERPQATQATPVEFLQLRELVCSLQAERRHTTRCINQLHNQLARVFPELGLLTNNIDEDWVLTLLDRYPTPQRIATARSSSLEQIPHITLDRARELQAAANVTTGSFQGVVAERIIKQSVRAVRSSQARESELEHWIQEAFQSLPEGGHRQLLTIPGIGPRTAAALVAKIVSIDRFETPEKLVSYFGVFPEQNSSGVDKSGTPLSSGKQRMSSRGSDLVRSLLWMAATSAIRWNPAVAALYGRQKAAGKRGDVALGHCMRKLLHQVFAVWKTNQPFDKHREGHGLPPAPLTPAVEQAPAPTAPVTDTLDTTPKAPSPTPQPQTKEAAAGRTGASPHRKAVTSTASLFGTRTVVSAPGASKPKQSQPTAVSTSPADPSGSIDFAELRRRVTMTQVLQHLGHLDKLQGSGPQRRGPCPVHDQQTVNPKIRHFSVNLNRQIFRCMHPDCTAHGNALDLWAAVHKLPLHAAATDLAKTLNIPIPRLAAPDHTHTQSQVENMSSSRRDDT